MSNHPKRFDFAMQKTPLMFSDCPWPNLILGQIDLILDQIAIPGVGKVASSSPLIGHNFLPSANEDLPPGLACWITWLFHMFRLSLGAKGGTLWICFRMVRVQMSQGVPCWKIVTEKGVFQEMMDIVILCDLPICFYDFRHKQYIMYSVQMELASPMDTDHGVYSPEFENCPRSVLVQAIIEQF